MPPAASRPESEPVIGDAERLLADVIEHSGACIKLLDLDGRVLKWSPRCEALYGIAFEDAVGRVLPHVPDDRRASALALIRSVAESGEITRLPTTAVNADGWRSRIEITAIPVSDGEGAVSAVLTVARDPLDEERFDFAREQLAAFVGRMLIEPLGTIINAAQLLQRPDVAGDAERRGRLVATVSTVALEVNELLEDLRATTNGSVPRSALNRQPTDVGALVAEVAAGLNAGAQRMLVDFDPGATPGTVDRARVARAVVILFRNALALANPGSTVLASVRPGPIGVAIDITYQGRRPSAAALEQAFASALPAQPDNAGPRLWTGLSVVAAIAEAHGGHASVAHDERGTTFSFTLRTDDAAYGEAARS